MGSRTGDSGFRYGTEEEAQWKEDLGVSRVIGPGGQPAVARAPGQKAKKKAAKKKVAKKKAAPKEGPRLNRKKAPAKKKKTTKKRPPR